MAVRLLLRKEVVISATWQQWLDNTENTVNGGGVGSEGEKVNAGNKSRASV